MQALRPLLTRRAFSACLGPARRASFASPAPLEEAAEGTRVVSRARPDGTRRVAWIAGARRLRRNLHRRYERLAALMPTRIPEERQLPLAPAV